MNSQLSTLNSQLSSLVLRSVSSFYYVSADAPAGQLPCRCRGKFRQTGTEPLPGDRVRWEPDSAHPGYGIITEILPRKNVFIRPNVANIDRLVFVASEARPRTEPILIDKLSAVAAHEDCDFLLVLNKCDLNPADELFDAYSRCGYRVIRCSAETGEGLDGLRHALSEGISVLTGNSGVGKSSLMNLLIPGLRLETAGISEKRGRGRHTTRHTELFPLPEPLRPPPSGSPSAESPDSSGSSVQENSSWIADTPGFAALELPMLADLSPEELDGCFPEFPRNGCRFPDCFHHKEPGCAVRDAVDRGEIPLSRYESYLRLLTELRNAKPW